MQGHSRTPKEGLSDDAIHSKYTATTAKTGPLLLHYTSDKLLHSILESGHIVPGGRTSTRNHVFMSRHRVSATGIIPDKFTKRMTNICIELDGTAMLRDNVTLYRSNANVVLCPHKIAIDYIISAKYFTWPQHTLYKRPSARALAHCRDKSCVCSYCHTSYVLGTQWCLNQCKVPLTTHAVQDHITYIPALFARVDELWRVYGLNFKSLQDLIDNDPASSIHPLAVNMQGVINEYRCHGNSKRQRSASPPQAPPTAKAGEAPPYRPPTAEAGVGHPTLRTAAPRAPRVQPLQLHGDPTVRGACSHLKNVDIRKFNKGATKRMDSNNQHYANHADRYQRDAGYRADCENHDPPTPEHLYWEDGSYAYRW